MAAAFSPLRDRNQCSVNFSETMFVKSPATEEK
jgi:hypothetical protein